MVASVSSVSCVLMAPCSSSSTLCVTGGSMLIVPQQKIFFHSMMKLLLREKQTLQKGDQLSMELLVVVEEGKGEEMVETRHLPPHLEDLMHHPLDCILHQMLHPMDTVLPVDMVDLDLIQDSVDILETLGGLI